MALQRLFYSCLTLLIVAGLVIGFAAIFSVFILR